ncbi:MAG: PTS sugar transporter subunit IIB [Anaerolineaceae bacterium]|jgi:PTS system galactitol-specific IIB component
MKTVYVVCASGIATSTLMRVKIERFLEERGIEVKVLQYRVTEISPERTRADAIVATTEIDKAFEEVAPVINGVSLITGIGQKATLEELARVLTENDKEK